MTGETGLMTDKSLLTGTRINCCSHKKLLATNVIISRCIFIIKATIYNTMKTNIINIGSSLGVILPSMFLRRLKLSFKSTLQIEVENGAMIIKPYPRQGWAEAARQMNIAGDDELLMDDFANEFDKEEWTWPK